MKFVMLAVRDVRADTFGTPFFLSSLAQGERQFSDEINRAEESNTLYKHPADFELYHLGFFDPQEGSFDLLPKPQQIAEGLSMVRRPGQDPRQLSLQ